VSPAWRNPKSWHKEMLERSDPRQIHQPIVPSVYATKVTSKITKNPDPILRSPSQTSAKSTWRTNIAIGTTIEAKIKILKPFLYISRLPKLYFYLIAIPI